MSLNIPGSNTPKFTQVPTINQFSSVSAAQALVTSGILGAFGISGSGQTAMNQFKTDVSLLQGPSGNMVTAMSQVDLYPPLTMSFTQAGHEASALGSLLTATVKNLSSTMSPGATSADNVTAINSIPSATVEAALTSKDLSAFATASQSGVNGFYYTTTHVQGAPQGANATLLQDITTLQKDKSSAAMAQAAALTTLDSYLIHQKYGINP